jgi:hypothetical protein
VPLKRRKSSSIIRLMFKVEYDCVSQILVPQGLAPRVVSSNNEYLAQGKIADETDQRRLNGWMIAVVLIILLFVWWPNSLSRVVIDLIAIGVCVAS